MLWTMIRCRLSWETASGQKRETAPGRKYRMIDDFPCPMPSRETASGQEILYDRWFSMPHSVLRDLLRAGNFVWSMIFHASADFKDLARLRNNRQKEYFFSQLYRVSPIPIFFANLLAKDFHCWPASEDRSWIVTYFLRQIVNSDLLPKTARE